MKKYFLLILTITFLSKALYAYTTETKYLATSSYFGNTLTEISQAKFSIFFAMYLVSISPDQPESQPYKLLSALIEAKNRGVDVKVILDQNINFETESLDDAVATNKNQNAYELLKKNGVNVFFDESQTFTHSKVMVIDGETVILGSTNWSKSAMSRNNEANVLIRSKELAQEIIADLNKIKLQENVPAILTPSIPVSEEFLSKKLIGELASSSDERAFDTYLYLLKEFDHNKDQTLTLDYDNLAKSLKIDQMTPEDYRRQITKVLDKLQEKYRLISYEKPGRNQNTTIKLNSIFKSNRESNLAGNIELPTDYFKHEWNKTLGFPAKVMLLVNFHYSQTSPNSRFSISRENLAKAHGLSESFISDGNRELKEQNLLDIDYSALENNNYSERQPNIYTPKNLYDPKELAEKLQSIQAKHGKDKTERAIETARLVFEEKNAKTIYALIELEDLYGQEVVKEASTKIAEKNIDNPKRSAGYLINTIKAMAKEPKAVAT